MNTPHLTNKTSYVVFFRWTNKNLHDKQFKGQPRELKPNSDIHPLEMKCHPVNEHSMLDASSNEDGVITMKHADS